MGDEWQAKDYWTAEEVAQFLGVKANSARTWLRLRHIKGAYRWPAEEVRQIRAQEPGKGHYLRRR